MQVLRLGDLDLHYQEQGSGPPLVLLHGLGGSSDDWDAQIGRFAGRYRVLAPDQRGFGRTGSGRQRTGVLRLAADLLAFLDAVAIPRCRLVGHSMGGAVAMQFAVNHPQRIERLVIANSVPSFQPQSARHYIEFAYRLFAMGVLGPARLAEIGAQRMAPGPEHAELRRRLTERGRHNTRTAYLSALASLARWSVMDRLDELTMPSLVLASQHDYFGHEETVKFAHALPRGRLHVVKGAHHGLPMEHPEAFNAVLARFLSGRVPQLRAGRSG